MSLGLWNSLVWIAATASAFVVAPEDQIPLNDKTVQWSAATGKRPNIVVVLTDDQDLQLGSLEYMPYLNHHLKEKGTFYKNHFVTTALCCPSRVSLWTGKQAHNTNVTDVSPPWGGYPKFVERGYNDDFLPVWLQEAGYNTYYTGKLFNAHTTTNYDSPHVKGFNGSDFLLDPYTYQYLHAHYQRNHNPPIDYTGRHTTDVITEKALGFLDDALASDRPFFVAIAPVAPHSNFEHTRSGLKITAPIPLDRHKKLFTNAIVPRTPNFNPDKPSGCQWISNLPKLSDSNIEYNDEFHRDRLRALQGVDELLDNVVQTLSDAGVLDNTYIIYTSDNGYHISQHRMQPGKETGFEEDIRVPLFIRGPDVPRNSVVDAVTTHIDLAPTIFEIAGIKLRDDFDGVPVPLAEETESSAEKRHEHVTVEYWGMAIEEGMTPATSHVYLNNTYKSLRVLSADYDLYYSVWCSNAHQLYDLRTDLYELNNLYPSPSSTSSSSNRQTYLLGYPLEKVISRLDALLMVTKSCKGVTCARPWEVLHPQGDVKSLGDALGDTYDGFYFNQVRNVFDRCEYGYILEAEGPQVPNVFPGGVHWSEWV